MRKSVLLALIVILSCLALPLAAEGAFGLSLNNGFVLLPIEEAMSNQTLYASFDYAFYLGGFILQPSIDYGACVGGGFIGDAGLGLGYRLLKAKQFSLETTLTPYAGQCGYLGSNRFVWGARAMVRGRLRLIGRLGILAQVGAEWREGTGFFELPVLGLGLSF